MGAERRVESVSIVADGEVKVVQKGGGRERGEEIDEGVEQEG